MASNDLKITVELSPLFIVAPKEWDSETIDNFEEHLHGDLAMERIIILPYGTKIFGFLKIHQKLGFWLGIIKSILLKRKVVTK